MFFQNLCSYFKWLPYYYGNPFSRPLTESFLFSSGTRRGLELGKLTYSGWNQVEVWDYLISNITIGMACNTRALFFWTHFDKHAESPIWAQMEHILCYLTSLVVLLFSQMPLSLQYVKNNPIATQSSEILSTIRKKLWLAGWLSAFSCLFQPPLLHVHLG